MAELEGVYSLSGRANEARKQYDLVELIGHHSKFDRAMYNREVTMLYADHNINMHEAYIEAKLEYGARRDILGADVLTWPALKAGKINEAQVAIAAALRLGARYARLFYHAGLFPMLQDITP